jgi:perosamine synthetase
VGLQPVAPWAETVPWLYCITIDEPTFGASRDDVAASLEAAGIETRPFFHPVHRLPPYAEASRRRGECLPVTDWLGSAGMNLPSYRGLTKSDIRRIVHSIRRRCAE